MGTVTETASGNNGWAWSGREPEWDKGFVTLAVSATHGQTARWQFIQGRDFSTEIASDSSGIVINEAAAKFMGFEHPVGEVITWTWWENKNRVMEYRILGVIKDMVMDSPYDPVEPSVFYLKGLNGTPNWINIRLRNTVSASNALPQIGQVFRKVIPNVPFEYKFVDQEYALKFAEEERIGKLASVFAVLAIFISSIGLFGLASFITERRTKEIGIRKVLGATVAHLWRMLSTEFVVLVVIACAVAVPLARYLMNNWLEKYSYRIEISIWTFLLTCIAALAIALLTVSFQAVKGAIANPVKSLRSE
jgi:ABC-type antimicrobial peptide transport system permease subunit